MKSLSETWKQGRDQLWEMRVSKGTAISQQYCPEAKSWTTSKSFSVPSSAPVLVWVLFVCWQTRLHHQKRRDREQLDLLGDCEFPSTVGKNLIFMEFSLNGVSSSSLSSFNFHYSIIPSPGLSLISLVILLLILPSVTDLVKVPKKLSLGSLFISSYSWSHESCLIYVLMISNLYFCSCDLFLWAPDSCIWLPVICSLESQLRFQHNISKHNS